MDTRQAAQWCAEVWERGWPGHDVAAISALYAEGAFWQQHPFRDPEPGYLARVFAEEESAECRFGVPIVDGDQAAVPWSAQTRLADGGTEDLAGVSFLRFRAGELVVEERDFWNHRWRVLGLLVLPRVTPTSPQERSTCRRRWDRW